MSLHISEMKPLHNQGHGHSHSHSSHVRNDDGTRPPGAAEGGRAGPDHRCEWQNGGDLGGFSPLSVFTGRSLSSLPLPPPPSSSLPQSPPSSPSLPCPQPPLASPRLTQLPPVSHSLPLPPPADTRLLTAAMALPHHRRALVPHVSETKPLNPWRTGWARDLFLLRTDGKTEARFLSERLPPLTSHLPLPTPKG